MLNEKQKRNLQEWMGLPKVLLTNTDLRDSIQGDYIVIDCSIGHNAIRRMRPECNTLVLTGYDNMDELGQKAVAEHLKDLIDDGYRAMVICNGETVKGNILLERNGDLNGRIMRILVEENTMLLRKKDSDKLLGIPTAMRISGANLYGMAMRLAGIRIKNGSTILVKYNAYQIGAKLRRVRRRMQNLKRNEQRVKLRSKRIRMVQRAKLLRSFKGMIGDAYNLAANITWKIAEAALKLALAIPKTAWNTILGIVRLTMAENGKTTVYPEDAIVLLIGAMVMVTLSMYPGATSSGIAKIGLGVLGVVMIRRAAMKIVDKIL